MAIDSAESLVGAIMQSSFVLTQRFHGAVAALACGVSYEVIMQKEGDKLNSIEQKNCTKDQCLQMIEGAVQKLKAVLV